MVNVYLFTDFRLYLKSYFSEAKKRDSRYSFRFFSRLAGFSSSGFLKMVMDGQRNLSPASINKLSQALKLNQKESSYFEALVLFNQAESRKDKDLYFERLASLKPPIKTSGFDRDQYEYFTQKHYVVLREMVALPDFKEDPAWIAEHLRMSLKAKDIEHALGVLLRLGLLKRNEDGKLIQAEVTLATPPEVNSLEVHNFHRAMMDQAKEMILEIPSELRDFSSLTIPIPKSSLKRIKDKIESFRSEIMSEINAGSQDFFEVYQINLQLFPVTKVKS